MARHRIGFWYRFAAVLVKPTTHLLFTREWTRAERIPVAGGFITVINHNSYLDPFSYTHFQYSTGRVPRFPAKVSLFQSGFVGAMMRRTGQIPVHRESADASGAFRVAVEAINEGECVAFYPEGMLTRAPRQWPMAGKTGAARVALLTRAPVSLVARWGANEAVPSYAKKRRVRLLPRNPSRVWAGPAVDLSRYDDREPNAAAPREVTDLLMSAISDQSSEIRQEPAPSTRFVPQGHFGVAGWPGTRDNPLSASDPPESNEPENSKREKA